MSKPHIIAKLHKYYHGDYWTFEVVRRRLALWPTSIEHRRFDEIPGRPGYEGCKSLNRIYYQPKL